MKYWLGNMKLPWRRAVILMLALALGASMSLGTTWTGPARS